MALSVVVLPAPFEPNSATTCPFGDAQRNIGDTDEVAVAHFEMLDLKLGHRLGHVRCSSVCSCRRRWRRPR